MMLGGESRCWLGAVQNKARADLIYRKSLLEETEMPKAQLRPSGGSPPAGSGEVTRGSRAGAAEPPSFQGGGGGLWPCSGSAARSDNQGQSGLE